MKKTKIYLIVTILVFLLSIVLVACGDKPSQDTPTEQEKKYTVTFVVDGEDYFTLETSGKSAIELPSNPTKDGYEFVGWYFDVNVWLNPCNSTSFANENLTANVTVYARWELIKETYSVTFVGGTGATGDAPTMEAKAEGDKFDLPQNTFVKEDYDFDGWFDGQTKYAAGDEYVMPSYAVTFTAQWVLTPKYKVTFVGGEGAVGTDPEIEDKKEGEVITLPENSYTKEDYIFAGWSDGEKTYLAAATYTMPKKDVEFVAVWEYSKYIVSFDSRGGSDVEAAKVDKNGKLTAPKQPKRNGYLFSGWYKNEDCTTLWDFDVDKVNGNITLYAKWVVDAVGISSVEGATIDGNNILMVIEKDVEFVELAEKVILANTNAYWNLYYDRLGQTKIPTKIAANQTDGSLDPAENVFYILVTSENGLQEKLYTLTIYRRFTVNVKYYDKDDNLIVDKDDATLTSYQMDTFNTINVAYDKYSAIGYSFDGWDIIVDGERVPFVFGENGTNVLDNVNLYAHVTPLQYVATFTLGDGETLDVTSQTMTYDAQYTLPVPQKTGYTFRGWYYEKSYDYIYLSDGNGASSSVWTVAQDVELKADWSVNYYTVSIEKNYDGAGRVYGGGQRAYDSDCTISVQSTNLGYTFVGWYDGETLLTTENAYTFKVPANDRSFAAKWEINEEMQPFEFTSSPTSCTITGLKNKSATEIVIPDCVTGIDLSAIRGCTGLTSITVSENNRAYASGDGILYDKNKTAFVYIPAKIQGSISISDSVTSIPSGAFNGCTGLTSVTIGSGVTSIGESAFRGCSGLTSVTIGSGVTSIGKSAFYNCTGLTNITIPDSVTSIGESAFRGCSGLTSVTIGKGVTSIPSDAFNGCTGLMSVTIGNGVTSIGSYAFRGCSELTSIYYTGDVAGWCGISELDELMSSSKTLYIAGNKVEGELVIPDGVTSIGSYAFSWCTGLTSVTIGSGVTSIGESAFRGCSGLTSITIPDSVTSIGNSVFSGCSGLTSVTIGSGVTSIGSCAFGGCSSLESITIPFVGAKAGLTSSNYYQYPFGYIFGTSSYTGGVATEQYYYYSTSRTTYDTYYIPSSLKSVVVTGGNMLYGAFYGCAGLLSVTIGNSVTSIGERAFYNCTELRNVTIPDSVTSIGERAFDGCTGLASVTIGSGVTSIGQSTFSGCIGLTTVNWNATACTSAGSKNYPIFNGRTNLTSVNIGNNVITIPSYAFDGCTGLTSVIIPDSVTSIGEDTFKGCSSLESITIPRAGVTSSSKYQYPLGYLFGTSSYTGGVATEQYYYGIYTSATYDTYYIPASLKSVTVTGGNIINGAFYGCTGLTSVTIGNSVKSIGLGAFKGCSSLKSITIPFVGASKTASKSYERVFGYIFGYETTTSSSSTVSGAINQYYDYWYYIPSSLKSVVISDGATAIPNYAFSSCTGLTSITIPDSVTSIGERAFYDCNGLTSITIPDSVTSIGQSTFSGCIGLTSVTIPNSVTSIGSSAFYNCTGLRNVTIPDSVTSIGSSAFENCSRLTRIDFTGTIAQWNKISRGSKWDYGNPLYTICCTDGTINK